MNETPMTIAQASAYRKRCLAYLQHCSRPVAPDFQEIQKERVKAARAAYNKADAYYHHIIPTYGSVS